MTIDINEARKLADDLLVATAYEQGPLTIDAARTIRALCDRVEEAEKIIKDAEWTEDDCPYCPCCYQYKHQQGHAEDCKLAAWLGKEKAPTPPTMPR